MQKYLARLAMLCSLLLLAACSSPKTGTAAPATATPAPRPATIYYGAYDTASSQLTVAALRWSYATSADAGTLPVLAAGVVYVTSSTSLIALDASTGKPLWSNPALANAQVIGAESGVLYANLASSTSSGALTTSVVAVNVSDGSVYWRHPFHNGEGDLLANGVVYGSDTLTPFGTPTSPHGAMLVALSASDGSVMWQSAQESGYLTPVQVAAGLVYSYNTFPMGGPANIEARHTSDGSLAWRFPAGPAHATILGLEGSALYAQTDDGNASDFTQNVLYALNATTGAVIWRSAVQRSPLLSANLVQQMIYVGDSAANTLTAIDAADGRQRWQMQPGAPGGSAATTALLVRAGCMAQPTCPLQMDLPRSTPALAPSCGRHPTPASIPCSPSRMALCMTPAPQKAAAPS